MVQQKSLSLEKYEKHLRATISWLIRSMTSDGGSSAYYSPLYGWSAPYPETSGYIITTLLDASSELGGKEGTKCVKAALELGDWLLKLQSKEGWWPGGLVKVTNREYQASVFNSAQIIDGMISLAHYSGENRWGNAAIKASEWLAKGVDEGGIWLEGNYLRAVNPSYYTQVAWPMLKARRIGASISVEQAARRVLNRIIERKNSNGVIRGWSFHPNNPAFTHTIGYTLRGLIESAYILDEWDKFGFPCADALNRLARKTELSNGNLPGAYTEDWTASNWYSCLTGNVQIALCLLRFEHHDPDLRLVNAAAKLVDGVCKHQRIDSGMSVVRGAVPGSAPLWGRYMFLRYPNWAAKYHADALISLINRLRVEGLR